MIVDPQYDFINGSLPVDGAPTAMQKLAAWIEERKGEFDYIAITVDWHPVTHCSFKNYGGEWPTHCVQFSHGAAIHQSILDAIGEKHYEVFTKGVDEDHEEYSIWKNAASSKKLHNIVSVSGIEEIVICGLAGNICVLNSLKDGLKELPNANFVFLKDFSPCIGSSDDVEKFIATTERVKIV